MEQNRLGTAVGSIKAVLAPLGQELEPPASASVSTSATATLKRRRGLLGTIPGVGKTTAAQLLAALSEHHGLTNAKQAATHVGLAPLTQESRNWKEKTRLCKTGVPILRERFAVAACPQALPPMQRPVSALAAAKPLALCFREC